ncbi:MAG: hypothetical protein D6681_08115 [Calditrichaeota bacterium]|nr:MAG: hypothetical protein D6681_08115 [Calditrichota bacterium]
MARKSPQSEAALAAFLRYSVQAKTTRGKLSQKKRFDANASGNILKHHPLCPDVDYRSEEQCL